MADKAALVIPGINEAGMAILHNTKDLEQYRKTVEDLLHGRCPFCTIDQRLNKIEHMTDSWYVWKSAFPQKHQALHLVIPHRLHLGHIRELNSYDWESLDKMNTWICEHYELPGGGLSLRFGDPSLHAGSVPGHLHWNIQIPDRTGKVNIVLHKDPAELKAKTKILLVFEKLRLGAKLEELDWWEQECVKGRV